jgi:hypothetical protein
MSRRDNLSADLKGEPDSPYLTSRRPNGEHDAARLSTRVRGFQRQLDPLLDHRQANSQ